MSSLTPRINKLDKNEIMNGNFDFWQRSTLSSFTNGTQGFVADRFKTYNQGSTSKTITMQRSSNIPTFIQSGYQSQYSYQFTSGTIVASLATSDYIIPYSYGIEGYDLQRWIGKDVTISFWTYSSLAGTYSVTLQNSNGTRGYVTTYTVSSPNTWEQKFINFTMDSVGPFLLDSGVGLNIFFNAISGSQYQTSTLNAWQSNNVLSASTSTNYMATSGATFNIAQVMMNETGSTSNQIFHRRGNNIGEELRMCQRYYEKTYDTDTIPTSAINNGYQTMYGKNAQYFSGPINYMIQKRVVPSITFYNPSTGVAGQARGLTGGGAVAIAAQGAGLHGFGIFVAVAVEDIYGFHWTADSEF